MIDFFFASENNILTSFFKLLVLCCRKYVSLSADMAEQQRQIDDLKPVIRQLKEQYLQTRDEACVVQASEVKQKLLFAKVRYVCLKNEQPALQVFIESLIDPLTTLVNSELADDMCREVNLYTLFYIASLYFVSLRDLEVLRPVNDSLGPFFWKSGRRCRMKRRVLTVANPAVAYTCLFEFVRIHGVQESTQPWSDALCKAMSDMICALHANIMKKCNPYGSSNLAQRGSDGGD